MLAPLALSAHLVLSLENDDFLVHAADDKIVVDLPSWRAGLAVIRLQPARGGRDSFSPKRNEGLLWQP
jgi:hypothetical protein